MSITQTPLTYQATVGIVVAFLLYLVLFLTGYIQFDVSSLLTFYAFSVFKICGRVVRFFFEFSFHSISIYYSVQYVINT